MFFNDAKVELKDSYEELLKIVGSLSRLSSESKTVYLYYRIAENIFCKAFEAENLSRSDCSIDAFKDDVGFGLKTFLHNNGETFQKVAEFNKSLEDITSCKSDKELVKKVSELRNERLETTARIHNLDVNKFIYHCVTRENNKFYINESKMSLIDIKKIKKVKRSKQSNNIILFEDGINQYKFNISKSTLLKKFKTEKKHQIETEIFEDPFEVLKALYNSESKDILNSDDGYPYIILPLYSPKSNDVEDKSGLNQWNAKPRKDKKGILHPRHEDEVYIPIPIWIHRAFPNFFPPKKVKFNLYLPNSNKEVISAKVCQEGNKALMSDPNKALGKWILRDILQKEPRSFVIMEDLIKAGTDSVEIIKKANLTSILTLKI